MEYFISIKITHEFFNRIIDMIFFDFLIIFILLASISNYRRNIFSCYWDRTLPTIDILPVILLLCYNFLVVISALFFCFWCEPGYPRPSAQTNPHPEWQGLSKEPATDEEGVRTPNLGSGRSAPNRSARTPWVLVLCSLT